MGILVITWNFPPRRGGIESLVSNLCAGLKQRHSVVVITAHAQFPRPIEEYVFRAPWPGLIPFAVYALWRGATLLFRNPALQVIWGGSLLVTPLVLMLARVFGRKAIVQAHGSDVIYSRTVYQALCVRWVKFCDRVVANSAYTRSLTIKKGARSDQVSIIPPGIHPERFAPLIGCDAIKRQFGLTERPTILFVGRLAKRKGVKEFIEKSFVEIVTKIPNVCFVVVGGNPLESLTQRDDMVAQIQSAIGKLGLLNHVQLLGTLDDDEVTKLYQAADVIVLPALATADDVEGFGVVLLEAAAAGKPVVATRVGGIPEAIEDGKSGILVDPGDYDQLTNAILSLLNDDRLKRGMGHRAAFRAQTQFCWAKVTADYELLLERAWSIDR
jgi:phosphatidylinositol alpha-1,6-mannosyltransferase